VNKPPPPQEKMKIEFNARFVARVSAG
jgi:hypothetical protein